MKIKLLIGIVLAIAAMAGIVGYEYHSVPVTVGIIVQCSDTRHQGNPVLSKDIKAESVPFVNREKYKVTTSFVVCDTCRIRNEKEQEQAEILRRQQEREKQKRREAESIYNSLEISSSNSEQSLAPGDSIGELSVTIKNKGMSVLDLADVRFILDSAQYVEGGPSDERTPYLHQMYEKKVKLFAKEGLPIMRLHYQENTVLVLRTTLAPSNDPHYEDETKTIGAKTSYIQYAKSDCEKVLKQQNDSGILFGELFFNWMSSLPLVLSHKAPEGSDVTISTSILIKGVKFHVNTLTVHVKRKDL